MTTVSDAEALKQVQQDNALLRQRLAELETQNQQLRATNTSIQQMSHWLFHGAFSLPMSILNSNALVFNAAVSRYNQMEEEIRQSEERLRHIVQHMPVLLIAFDAAGAVIVWNEECERVTGYAAAEVVGNPHAMELLIPDAASRDRLIAEVAEKQRQGWNYRDWEWDITTKDATVKTIAWSNVSRQFPVPGWSNWAVGVDVTERKQLEREREAALSESQLLLQAVVDHTPATIAVKDIAGRYLLINQHGAARRGLAPEQIIGRTDDALDTPDTATSTSPSPALQGNGQHVLATGSTIQREEVAVLDDGVYTYLAIQFPLYNTREEIYAVGSIIADMSERKRTEAELHRTQALLEAIIANSSTAIYVKDTAGRYLLVNQRAEQNMGYQRDEIIGKTDSDLFPGEFARVFWETEQQVLASRSAVEREEVLPRYDGLHTYLSVKFPLYDAEGTVYAVGGISTDITERKRSEEALHRTQAQLRSLARRTTLIQEKERRRLSRELHDEAGQALTVLLISLQLIHADVPPAYESIRQRLTEAANLASTTMDRLRVLAHGLRPAALDTLGLHDAIMDACATFSRSTGLSVDVSPTPLPDLADETRVCLYRFVQESLTNVARHAQAQHVWVTLSSDDETVSVAVEDDGQGISRSGPLPTERLALGMGLLGLRERLGFLGGTLEVNSLPGQGTRVVAIVPRSQPTRG